MATGRGGGLFCGGAGALCQGAICERDFLCLDGQPLKKAPAERRGSRRKRDGGGAMVGCGGVLDSKEEVLPSWSFS